MASLYTKITNNILSVTLDNLTGEPTAFINEKNGENFLKSYDKRVHQPFLIHLNEKNAMIELYPPRYEHIKMDASLSAEIEIKENERETIAEVSYKRLVSDIGIYDVAVKYTIALPKDSNESIWTIDIQNNHDKSVVEQVYFPNIQGIYLGESWKENVLLYPYRAGERIVNPIEYFEKENITIGWKWQEYNYTYNLEGIDRKEKSSYDSYFQEMKYSGPLSMMWLDYSDSKQGQGIYFACHDEKLSLGALRAETFGLKRVGMGFSVVKYPYIGMGEQWKSPNNIIAIHSGDWHWSADRYRSFRESIPNKAYKNPRPKWFEKSAGLMAHYDFKYQSGRMEHHFKDIPRLYEEAKELGLNHLLLAGWHKDGFDNGFPEYIPDAELGTTEELIDVINGVKTQGGHIGFYVNSRLSNTKYIDREEQRKNCVAIKQDGTPYNEKYGYSGIEFEIMCPQSEEWRNELCSTLCRLTDSIGIDNVYLDQFAMSPPRICFNEKHDAHPASWNQGTTQILSQLHNVLDQNDFPVLLYEGISDIYGEGVCGQLISSFTFFENGAFPEMYKYTFPNQIIVDMLYPGKNLIMRPVHVALQSRRMIRHAFLIGTYYWIYDLVDENSFVNDPEGFAYLKKVIELRKQWLAMYGHGIYRDTISIASVSKGIDVRKYERINGALLAVSNPNHSADSCVQMNWEKGKMPKLYVHTLERPETKQSLKNVVLEDGLLTIPLSNSELSIIIIEE